MTWALIFCMSITWGMCTANTVAGRYDTLDQCNAQLKVIVEYNHPAAIYCTNSFMEPKP